MSTLTRAELLALDGCLTIVRQPAVPVRPAIGQPGSNSTYVPDSAEVFVAMLSDGRIFAFNGHVDLGTGIRTSLAQIVAEELGVSAERVEMVLGHSASVPNQGPTIASATIQLSAVPLRCAAAQARLALLELASRHFALPPDRLITDDGVVVAPGASRIAFADLLHGKRLSLTLDLTVAVKDPANYTVVGRSTPRVDLPAKATGELVFVHDIRVPGMVHGRVIRPPYAGHDCGDFVGKTLIGVDRSSIEHIPGVLDVVAIGDFVGVIAEREEQAIRAARALRVQWRRVHGLPDMSDPASAIAAAPAVRRDLKEHGDTDAANALPGVTTIARTYAWPYQMHASIGPSCAVADYTEGAITVWSGTQNPQTLRHDLSRLADCDEGRVNVIRLEAAGCYGRNCADDVAGDALLLSRAAGRPVRVQLSRADEHLWEPKGTGQVVQVTGSVSASGETVSYAFSSRYPSNDAPLLALLLTGALPAEPRVYEMGDRTAVSPYTFPNVRYRCEDLAPLVRSSWLRGVSAMPNSFAHDAFIDELAFIAQADPLAFRLRHLDDRRASELLEATAARAGWSAPIARPLGAGRVLTGRGIAYARYVHSRFPGFGAAWSAWVVDLEVDAGTGEIRLTRVTVGQDTGTMINPDGVRHQIHGNVIQTISRVLKERVRFSDGVVASREWGSYPMLTFPELPAIDVVMMPRQGEPPMGAGESASVPGPAAIANALFNATGVRFYAPPFTPDVVRERLAEHRQADLAEHK